MRHEDPGVVQSDPGAQHRRGGVRHRVALQALMQHPSGATVPCEIVDVSNGGMALEIREAVFGPDQASFAPGTVSLIRFSPRLTNDPGDAITARCSVMWLARRALGVRFEQTDTKLRAALKEIVHAAVAERMEDEQPADDEPSAEQRRVLKACRRTLQKHVPNLVWTMRSNVAQRLLARAAQNLAEAKHAANDAALIEAKAMSIGLTAEHRFLSSFAEVFGILQTQELTVTQIRAALREAKARASAAGPGGKDEDRLLARVVQEGVERYGARFLALDARLASICEHGIDDVSNPLAPATACRILWLSVTEHCPSVLVRQALELVMLKQVVPLLGDLYDALEQVLDEQGVERLDG